MQRLGAGVEYVHHAFAVRADKERPTVGRNGNALGGVRDDDSANQLARARPSRRSPSGAHRHQQGGGASLALWAEGLAVFEPAIQSFNPIRLSIAGRERINAQPE
jgi:hypothetical protein